MKMDDMTQAEQLMQILIEIYHNTHDKECIELILEKHNMSIEPAVEN